MGRIANAHHDIRVYWLTWRTQLRAATKLRAAFILQITGMVANNLALMTAWWFLFEHFGTINGWSGAELIGVQGINMFIFGIAIFFSSGLYNLPRYVDQGTFDSFLTRPVGLLPQITGSSIEIAAIGDILLGIILIIWYAAFIHAGLLAVLLFLLMVIVGVVLMWCFTLLPFLLAFYLFNSEQVSRYIAFFYLDTGLYPSGVLSGPIRTILLTAFPGLFIGAIPLDVLRGIGWEFVVLGFVIAIFWLFVSLKLFRHAVKKYESANLVGAR